MMSDLQTGGHVDLTHISDTVNTTSGYRRHRVLSGPWRGPGSPLCPLTSMGKKPATHGRTPPRCPPYAAASCNELSPAEPGIAALRPTLRLVCDSWLFPVFASKRNPLTDHLGVSNTCSWHPPFPRCESFPRGVLSVTR